MKKSHKTCGMSEDGKNQYRKRVVVVCCVGGNEKRRRAEKKRRETKEGESRYGEVKGDVSANAE